MWSFVFQLILLRLKTNIFKWPGFEPITSPLCVTFLNDWTSRHSPFYYHFSEVKCNWKEMHVLWHFTWLWLRSHRPRVDLVWEWFLLMSLTPNVNSLPEWIWSSCCCARGRCRHWRFQRSSAGRGPSTRPSPDRGWSLLRAVTSGQWQRTAN